MDVRICLNLLLDNTSQTNAQKLSHTVAKNITASMMQYRHKEINSTKTFKNHYVHSPMYVRHNKAHEIFSHWRESTLKLTNWFVCAYPKIFRKAFASSLVCERNDAK